MIAYEQRPAPGILRIGLRLSDDGTIDASAPNVTIFAHQGAVHVIGIAGADVILEIPIGRAAWRRARRVARQALAAAGARPRRRRAA